MSYEYIEHTYGVRFEVGQRVQSEDGKHHGEVTHNGGEERELMLKALKSAEAAEASLIGEWADFWDVAPQSLIDKLMEAQRLRNIALTLAESHPLPAPVEEGQTVKSELAREIVTRIVTNCVEAMWTRNIEPLENDEDADFPTEEELLIDALGIALGDDIGCLDEGDEDFRERIDLYWLEDRLSSPTEEAGTEI